MAATALRERQEGPRERTHRGCARAARAHSRLARHVMLMANHGVATTGASVAAAFDDLSDLP